MGTATASSPPNLKGPLADRVVLVTGGTRGIGAAISRHLAADGAEIAAGYWRQAEPAEKFLAEVTAQHLFGLTKSLAREAMFMLAREGRPVGDGIGLTVNGVTPGYVATDMMATIPDKVLDRLRSQIPAGRFGKPDEVARVVAFLANDDSSYVTGQIWAVNGGLDM